MALLVKHTRTALLPRREIVRILPSLPTSQYGIQDDVVHDKMSIYAWIKQSYLTLYMQSEIQMAEIIIFYCLEI